MDNQFEFNTNYLESGYMIKEIPINLSFIPKRVLVKIKAYYNGCWIANSALDSKYHNAEDFYPVGSDMAYGEAEMNFFQFFSGSSIGASIISFDKSKVKIKLKSHYNENNIYVTIQEIIAIE